MNSFFNSSQIISDATHVSSKDNDKNIPTPLKKDDEVSPFRGRVLSMDAKNIDKRRCKSSEKVSRKTDVKEANNIEAKVSLKRSNKHSPINIENKALKNSLYCKNIKMQKQVKEEIRQQIETEKDSV